MAENSASKLESEHLDFGRRTVPFLFFTRDFFREICAEKGDTCSWKFKLDDWISFNILSKVSDESMAMFLSESSFCCIPPLVKLVHMLPQSKYNNAWVINPVTYNTNDYTVTNCPVNWWTGVKSLSEPKYSTTPNKPTYVHYYVVSTMFYK